MCILILFVFLELTNMCIYKEKHPKSIEMVPVRENYFEVYYKEYTVIFQIAVRVPN